MAAAWVASMIEKSEATQTVAEDFHVERRKEVAGAWLGEARASFAVHQFPHQIGRAMGFTAWICNLQVYA